MKALTLTQPWAQLMADGRKSTETRSWPAPRSAIGQLLAIHAAKGWKQADVYWAGAWRYDPDDLPRGAIVAVVRLLECVSTDRATGFTPPGGEADYGDYTPGRFAWRTTFVQRLRTPIRCPGKLGLWELDEATEAMIREEISDQE